MKSDSDVDRRVIELDRDELALVGEEGKERGAPAGADAQLDDSLWVVAPNEPAVRIDQVCRLPDRETLRRRGIVEVDVEPRSVDLEHVGDRSRQRSGRHRTHLMCDCVTTRRGDPSAHRPRCTSRCSDGSVRVAVDCGDERGTHLGANSWNCTMSVLMRGSQSALVQTIEQLVLSALDVDLDQIDPSRCR